MKATSEQEAELRLLADGELYREAANLASEQRDVIGDRQLGNQMNGLLEYSRSWEELTSFVAHQKDRNWTGRRQAYQGFYSALHQYLNDLRADVKDQHHFVPDGLTNREAKERTRFFAGWLARAFIQHLVAEMMWQKEV